MIRRSFLGLAVAAALAPRALATQQIMLGMGASGGGLLVVDAADFDGTNDYMRRASNMTGAVDCKTGIFSVWINTRSFASNGRILSAGNSPNIELEVGVASDGSLGIGLNGYSSDAFTAAGAMVTGTWYNVLSSWDLVAGRFDLYINDANAKDPANWVATNTNVNFSSAVTSWVSGIAIDAINFKYNGGMAELYLAINTTLDLSVVANRRKFISSTGKPVDLGSNGGLPTGSAPLVYEHLADLEAAADFATNRTGNGNFTVTGALTTFASSPSD